MVFNFILLIFIFTHLLSVLAKLPCSEKKFNHDSFVCLCNSSYCDNNPRPSKISLPEAWVITTSKDRFRLNHAKHSFVPGIVNSDTFIDIDESLVFQSIIGFGGAFTDTASMLIKSLPVNVSYKVIDSYFSIDGSEYNIARVPMAGTDFSNRIYSYDDYEGDFSLNKFILASEDYLFKIPLIKRAIELTDKSLKLFGSPWSAPAWMKTNKNITGNGTLIGKPGGPYFKTWANYFLKFLQFYEKQDIHFWGLTLQNEPTDGNLAHFFFNAMGWTPETQRDFVKKDLGPLIRNSSYKDVKLMMLDDNRLWIRSWTSVVLSDKIAASYIDGVAVHWYLDNFVPPDVLDWFKKQFPTQFLLYTEACPGMYPWQEHVALGDWNRAQNYAHNIIQNLLHGVSGWLDWNLALDPTGGPGWAGNRVDSSIIVNLTSSEFYKQPMYYVIAHFSKYIHPEAVRIRSKVTGNSGLEAVAFRNLDQSIVIVVLNSKNMAVNYSLRILHLGTLQTIIPSKSIQTILFWRSNLL